MAEIKKSKKSKKSKQKTENEAAAAMDTSELNLQHASPKKIKNEKSDNEVREASLTRSVAVDKAAATQRPVSQVRNIKKRLELECDYIERISCYIRLPSTSLLMLDQHDSDDELANTTEQPRQGLFVSGENRAKSHQELRDRFQKKLEEIRANKGQSNPDKLKTKLSKAMKRDDKKKKEKDALKQNLIKAGKHSGNLNKVKLENQFEGVRAKDDRNGGEKIVFSKFDFVVEPESGLKAVQKKHMDPKAALNKIAKTKEKMDSMKEKGLTEKVARIETKMAWQKSIDKAAGAKLKDDVDLLKKSLKRKEQRKKSSAKKWEERKENVEKKKEGRQKKRETNLKKRKDGVKDKKKKLAIKKGRLIPGL